MAQNNEEISADKSESHEKMKFIDPIQILVIGGFGEKIISSDIFLLDYYQKIWKRVSLKLPYGVCGHGTVILDDQLYIIGGCSGSAYYCNSLYRLNKQMKWEKMADMQEKRAYITNSCISHNGCIWVIGGLSGNITYLNTMEIYNPPENRWKKKPAMKRLRRSAAAVVINNKIYVCGGLGWNHWESVEVFDIDSEVWVEFYSLPVPRMSMSIIAEGAGIILIGGNSNLSIENTVWKMDVEEENPKWINLPPLNENRSQSSAIRLETGCILVFGGEKEDSQTSRTVEIFDGQKWEAFTPLPKPRSEPTSVVLTSAMIDIFRPYIEEIGK